MRFCPNCGYEVFDEENFCAMCDTPLDWDVVPKRIRYPRYLIPQLQPIPLERTVTINCPYCYAPLIGQSLGWVTDAWGLRRELCPVCHGSRVITSRESD
jgi:hypothetical protein